MSEHERGAPGLALQFLTQVEARPPTHAETTDARRTSCPHLSVGENARGEGLVAQSSHPTGPQRDTPVLLTPPGAALLHT